MRRPPSLLTALLVVALADGCGDNAPTPVDPSPSPGDPNGARYVERLETAQDFAALQGEGWSVKYLGAVDGRKPPAPLDRRCVFQNTAAYPLHLQFLRSFPELANLDFDSYLALATKNSTRVWWAGELQLVPGGTHPVTGRRGILAL
ncbi:MAG TPA: hypothetical protein VNO55_28590, partial [Polyangia bacterium]|nr:hypothetical protein [Polyangia bacterium]